MASDWTQDSGDGDMDTFGSMFPENPLFGDESLDNELTGIVPQTTDFNPELYGTSATKAPTQTQPGTLPQSQNTQPHSTVSSLSPESSAQDSSSDSSGHRKRKTSSTSSPMLWPNMSRHMNSLKVSDQRRDENNSMSQTPKGIFEPGFGSSPPASFSMNSNMEFNDRSMAGFFDIDSAAASPGAFGTVSDLGTTMASDSTVVPPDPKKRRAGIPQRSPPMANNPANFFIGSRDQSPLGGAVGTNRNVGPGIMFNTGSSPPNQYGVDTTWTSPPSNLWDSTNYGMDTINFSPSPVVKDSTLRMSEPKHQTTSMSPQLYIDPTTRKSRVETQIPIKLTLSPLPEGVTKLHLPTHTIAKPKMLAKEAKRAPDTLELHVMLVCASAMKNEQAKQRALRLAAGLEQRIEKENSSSNRSSPQQGEADDDPDKPLNGGEVRICKNCINREAKRAARKKIKSPDDESQWRQYEHDRVVVFNTHEYKEWKPWEPTKSENAMDSPDQLQSIPEGSSMVEIPMRIACYCRHQGEKEGFQIIFTIKDFADHLIAQNVSDSILITDDHKTQPGSLMPDASSSYVNLPSASYMASEQAGHLSRPYHSTPDLFALQQHPQSFLPQQQLYHSSRLPSKNTSATETPKNLSRPASPDGSSSGPNKKRKGSGPSTNRFSGLMMTPMPINTTQQAPPTSMPNSAGPASATAAGQFSGFPSQRFSFPQTTEGAGLDSGFSQPLVPSYFPNEPPSRMNTRNESFGNSFYSAPGSQMPSRASSPVSHRPNPSYQNNLAQRVQANFNTLANPTITSPTEGGLPQAPPMIHKLSPAEGPTAGNTEVSIYGSSFYPGLDVMFGHTAAISTTYWGEKALLCVLPPNPQPGPVNVTFTGLMQPMFSPPHTQPAIFTYKDDNKERRDMLELFKKMMTDQGGYIPDNYMDYMQSYMPSGSPNHQGGPSGSRGGMHHSYNRSHAIAVGTLLNSSDTEDTILKFLERQNREAGRPVDLDLKLQDGSTLLSLACSMGYARVVGALLARHANPDTRDANGLTPLGIAAMRDHIQIIRLLLRKGADPTVRTLQGRTAAELASSEEARLALAHIPNHSRNSSGIRSLKSGRSSPDLRSLNSFYTTTDESGYSSEEGASRKSKEVIIDRRESVLAPTHYQSRPQSRRNSLAAIPASLNPSQPSVNGQPNLISPYAAMTAWRDSLSAQIQHFQESMHLNLSNFPTWQLPTLPPMPNLPDYQDHPMMRRISSLVPNRHSSPPPACSSAASSSDETQRPSEVHHGFWDFFSSAPAPPSYEDLYPGKQEQPICEDKNVGTAEAVMEAVLDQTCEQKFDVGAISTPAGSMSPEPVTVRNSRGECPTGERHSRLKSVNARKLKKVDQKLLYCCVSELALKRLKDRTSER